MPLLYRVTKYTERHKQKYVSPAVWLVQAGEMARQSEGGVDRPGVVVGALKKTIIKCVIRNMTSMSNHQGGDTYKLQGP
jgi:hypothetical protein